MCIAQKEAKETEYWLWLLHEGGFLTEKEYSSMQQDVEELLSVLAAICKTTQNG
jgi:four helix bundle protein